MAEGVQVSGTCRPGEAATTRASRTLRSLVIFVASGAFIGYVPVAPGTAGSLVGLLLVRFALASFWRHSPTEFVMLFAIAFTFACGVAGYAEKILAKPDSSLIVLDEIFGMVATMFGNPSGWKWLATGFTLFRLFDIIKPWPSSSLDRMKGGTGVLLDDLAAAFYANITLRVLRQIA